MEVENKKSCKELAYNLSGSLESECLSFVLHNIFVHELPVLEE